MKKRLLSLALALTMVIGSFNVVFAEEKILIDADYAYAYAYVECDEHTGYASTSFYPTSTTASTSSTVSASLFAYTASPVDSASDSSSLAGTLDVSVELSYYVSTVSSISSSHSVTLDGVTTSANLGDSN